MFKEDYEIKLSDPQITLILISALRVAFTSENVKMFLDLCQHQVSLVEIGAFIEYCCKQTGNENAMQISWISKTDYKKKLKENAQ